MKALPLPDAMRIVKRLRPQEHTELLDPGEAFEHRSVMPTLNQVNKLLAIMAPTEKDMHEVRQMMLCELTREAGVREQVLYQLVHVHERLYRSMRMQPLLDDLPSLAVFVEKLSRGRPKAMDLTELSKSINNAMFGGIDGLGGGRVED